MRAEAASKGLGDNIYVWDPDLLLGLPLSWFFMPLLPYPSTDRTKNLFGSFYGLFILFPSLIHIQISLPQSENSRQELARGKKRNISAKGREDGALREGSIPEEVGTRGGEGEEKGEEERRRKAGLSL